MGLQVACIALLVFSLVSQKWSAFGLVETNSEEVLVDNQITREFKPGALPSSCNCSDIVLGTDVTIDGIQDLSPRHYRRVKQANTGKHYWRLCKSYTSSTISSVDCDWTGEMIPSNNMAAIWKSPRGKRGTFWVIGPFRKLFKRIGSFRARVDQTNSVSCPYTPTLEWYNIKPKGKGPNGGSRLLFQSVDSLEKYLDIHCLQNQN